VFLLLLYPVPSFIPSFFFLFPHSVYLKWDFIISFFDFVKDFISLDRQRNIPYCYYNLRGMSSTTEESLSMELFSARVLANFCSIFLQFIYLFFRS
jgi:hypothetical protein